MKFLMRETAIWLALLPAFSPAVPCVPVPFWLQSLSGHAPL